MITAIVNKEDANAVCNTDEGRPVTKLSPDVLMAGNMTLLIGTDDERWISAWADRLLLQAAQRGGAQHRQLQHRFTTAYPLEVTVGGATVFVTNVERFEKL
ncbi:MAG: cyclic-di-AMP receptor [Ruthenibacterium lactatiformans]